MDDAAERKARLRAKMEARRKAKEESGEAAREREEKAAAAAEAAAKAKKKEEMKGLAALLGGELDELAKAEEERRKVQERLEKGEPATETLNHKLFQTLYEYKSEDPDDLEFEAGEILQVTDWEDEWYEGSNQQGKRGTFPATYVREIKTRGAPKVLGAAEDNG